MKALRLVLAAAVGLCLASSAHALPFTIVDYTSFGGDGWIQNGEVGYGAGGGAQTFLTSGNTERGLAYNPATGNVLLVSRNGGNNVRVLSGVTGVDNGSPLNVTGVTGGTFAANMIGVASDGVIYMGNLGTSANSFKLYRWANEASIPTTSGALTHALTRLGDTLDVIGTGNSSTIVAGAGSGLSGYATVAYDGVSYSLNQVSPIAGTANGDFRLGVTFGANATTVMGTQSAGAASGFRLTTYSGTTGTLVDSSTLTAGNERAMDYAVVNGVPLLATLDTGSSSAPNSGTGVLRVYDMTDPNNPVLLGGKRNSTITDGLLVANTNATGQVKFGAINGDKAIIYGLVTNNGIQAFEITVVPEAGAFLCFAAVAAVTGGWRLRRRSARS